MVLLDGRVIDGDTGIVDGLVHHAEGIGLWRPLEIINGLRPVAFAGRVDLVDRDHFARLGLGQQVLVVKPPPCGGVAAESLAAVLRIGAGSGSDVDDAQLDHVAFLRPADEDRAGADMHAKAFAGAASEQRSIHWPGAASVDTLFVLGPQEHAFGAGVALHHAFGVVIGVVSQCLDGDEVAGIDFDRRFQFLAEIAPMDGVGIGGQMVIGPLGRLVLLCGRGHLRGDERDAASGHRRRTAGCCKARSQEGASFPIKGFLELVMVQFEVRTVPVVARAHLCFSCSERPFKRTYRPVLL